MTELDGTELVDWRQLPPAHRRGWWEQLWDGVIALSDRYRLALRSHWWRDAVQVEALAAFIGWLRLYDTGAYNDPPGKLQLLWELERLRAVLRGGEEAFDHRRDRAAFEHHLDSLKPNATQPASEQTPELDAYRPHGERGQAVQELSAITARLWELRERRDILEVASELGQAEHNGGVRRDLCEIQDAIEQLADRERRLHAALGSSDD